MFGKKAKRIEELETQVIGLEKELDEARPFLSDARAIGAHVRDLLQRQDSINYTSSQIAQLAFKNIRQQREQEARDRLVREYAAEHEDAMYARIVEEIRREEGPSIAEDVAAMVGSDAALTAQLQKRARELVWQESLDRIAAAEGAVAEEALLIEEQRRIYFNRCNDQFRFDSEMNLADEELLSYLKHGDKLRLEVRPYKEPEGDGASIEFMWQKISEKTQGWLLFAVESERTYRLTTAYYSNQGSTLSLPRHTVDRIGVIDDAYSDKFTRDLIRTNMPLCVQASDSKYKIWFEQGRPGTYDIGVVSGFEINAKDIEL